MSTGHIIVSLIVCECGQLIWLWLYFSTCNSKGILLSSSSYLDQLHHWDRVEEVKAAKPVQSVGGAGNVSDGQGRRVAGKDGVSKTRETDKQMSNNK